MQRRDDDALQIYDDARLYDLIAPPAGEAAAFYLDLARRAGGPVLELACGTGRVLGVLADAGVEAWGLDLSPPMLAAARRAHPGLQLHFGDMRAFELGARFGLIYVTFNSLLHLHSRSDFEGLFASVARHLAPGGLFAFDVFKPELRILVRQPGERYVVLEVDDPAVGGTLRIEETTDFDRLHQSSRTTWYWSWPGRKDARVDPLNLRILFPEELLALLHYNGFEVVERYGDFDRRPPEDGELQVLVARRAG